MKLCMKGGNSGKVAFAAAVTGVLLTQHINTCVAQQPVAFTA